MLAEDRHCADLLDQFLRLQRVSDAAYARVPACETRSGHDALCARREALAARAEALDWKVDAAVRALVLCQAGSWRTIALKLIAWRAYSAMGRPPGFIDADQVLAFSAYRDALRLADLAGTAREDDAAVWTSIAGGADPK
ncbi:MAG: hypothetical protein DCF16_09510 [Alphaproteobacteria bacterium]|nr:MAG: hypothetical protein DCF16_09510 [Alphaproteobacteria bacterium]